jgi:hypothetical protein
MEKLVHAMSENIAHTVAVYEQILETELAKQRAIVASDVEGITAAVAREEELVAAAGRLEAERLDLRYRLAQADRRLGPNSRLLHVIEILDGPPRDLLASRRDRLLGLSAQISEVNRLNFQLLRSSLDLLREILDDVFGSPPDPRVYDPSGRPTEASPGATRVDHML